MSTKSQSVSVKASLIKDKESVDYGKLIQDSSKRLQKIPDDYDIFISHASAGNGTYPDEKDFVLTLQRILTETYKKKVYLDLIYNDSYQYAPVISAARLSKYGVFICSLRYITITLGKRSEKYAKEYDTIIQEIDVFMGKERFFGFRIIPVKFGLTDDVYRQKGPFGHRFYISIVDEEKNSCLDKAAYVASKIIDKINDVELKETIKTS